MIKNYVFDTIKLILCFIFMSYIVVERLENGDAGVLTVFSIPVIIYVMYKIVDMSHNIKLDRLDKIRLKK
jgi:hypothetical protein